jgi:hypothetical protein
MQASTSMAYASALHSIQSRVSLNSNTARKMPIVSDIMVAWAAGNLMNVVSHDTAIVQTT